MAKLPEQAKGILSYLVHHRTAANLLLLLMVISGLAATTQIRSQFLPDIIIESVTVRVGWPGAGPEDVDRLIVGPLEPSLLAINGIASLESVSREGQATLSLEFEPTVSMDTAVDEVRAAVNGVTTLPEDANDPTIRRGAWRDRVSDVVITGPLALAQISQYAEELQQTLFREGISRTRLRGLPEPVIRVDVPNAELIRHRLTLREIATVITSESEAGPAGEIAGGTARIRAGQERQSAEDIGDIVLRSARDATALRVSDVARITTEGIDNGEAYYVGDNPAVVLTIERGADGDAVAMQAQVERAIERLESSLPDEVTILMTRTRAQNITDRIDILLSNGLTGLVLVVGLLFLFLSARTAFWVAAGIPVAMIATLGLMFVAGITLNMVSLFALIICLGIVVDDAIVVSEHADSLARKGYSPGDAAAGAAMRMAAPVFSASITTIIAFSALILVGGRFGQLIVDIPFTVSVVLLASLAESFLILPAHMNHALSRKRADDWFDAPSRVVNRGFEWFREHIFRKIMRWVLICRYPVVGSAIFLLLFTATLYKDGSVRWRFFNAPERSSVSANIAMLNGATRDDTRAQLTLMQQALDRLNAEYEETHGIAPVKSSLQTLGGGAGRPLSGSDLKDRDLLGGFTIELIDPDLRPYSMQQVIGDWQDSIARHPLLETLSLRGFRAGPGGDGIDVALYGADAIELKEAAEALKTDLRTFSAVSGLEDNLAYDKTELQVQLTPRGETLGFTTEDLASELRQRLGGIETHDFADGTRNVEVIVRSPDAELTSSYVYDALVATPGGGHVPLHEIADISSRLGFSSVLRENGLRTVSVTGTVSEDDPAAASEVQQALVERIAPDIAGRYGIGYEIGGLLEQEREFLSDALLGGILCLVGIYLTLAWIFASWIRPLTVMIVIPFGLIGMVWGHYWHSVPISMFSIVGLIGMAGIIINDSIVLVTTIDEEAEHKGLTSAIIDGACLRLRAVFLTTATTVFGLLPLLFETSRQAQFLMPTVITLAYGLGFGMFLVLLVTPSVLAIQRDISMSLRSALRLRHIGNRRGGLGRPVRQV